MPQEQALGTWLYHVISSVFLKGFQKATLKAEGLGFGRLL